MRTDKTLLTLWACSGVNQTFPILYLFLSLMSIWILQRNHWEFIYNLYYILYPLSVSHTSEKLRYSPVFYWWIKLPPIKRASYQYLFNIKEQKRSVCTQLSCPSFPVFKETAYRSNCIQFLNLCNSVLWVRLWLLIELLSDLPTSDSITTLYAVACLWSCHWAQRLVMRTW